MTSREKRIIARNDKIRARYDEIKAKYPKWRYDAWVEELAKEFLPLSVRSINGILNFEYEKLLEKRNQENTDQIKLDFKDEA